MSETASDIYGKLKLVHGPGTPPPEEPEEDPED
jgi:hypothetical protein